MKTLDFKDSTSHEYGNISRQSQPNSQKFLHYQTNKISSQVITRKTNQLQSYQSQFSKREYCRLNEVQKLEFLKKTLKEGKKLNQASKEIGIKYATAKTILYKYRENKKLVVQENEGNRKRTDYRKIQKKERSNIRVEISLCGETVNTIGYDKINEDENIRLQQNDV